MKEVLYIDGKLADLPKSGGGVNLNIKSNILDNFGLPIGNYTNTIKLPLTSVNAQIFGVRGEVAVVNDVPYDVHDARYIRDGREIITNGKLYLLAVSDSYEVSIVWRRDNLGALIDGNDTLDMLGDQSAVVLTAEHQTPSLSSELGNDVINAWYDSDKDSDGISQPPQGASTFPFLPSLFVPTIISAIESRYGITITGYDSLLNLAYIPLVGREGNAGDVSGQTTIRLYSNFEAVGRKLDFQAYTSTMGDYIKRATVAEQGTDNAVVLKSPLKIQIQATLDFFIYAGSGNITPPAGFSLWAVNENRERISMLCDTWTVGTNNMITMDIMTIIEVEAGDVIAFAFACENGVNYGINMSGATRRREVTITSPFAPKIQNFGQSLPVWKNLPKVKVLDFIYTLCAITGAYCVIERSTIELRTYNGMATRAAIDKTADLILASRMMKPKNIAFKVNGWEAVNLLQWANGYEGEIDVNNAQLTGSRDWFKSSFNVPTLANGWGLPCFVAKNEKDTIIYEWEKADPYISRVNTYQAGGTYRLRLDRAMLDFSALVPQKYSSVQAWLEKPVVVKAQMAHGYDLLNAERIYLAQFGAYFTPLSIQIDGKTDNAIVELLKI